MMCRIIVSFKRKFYNRSIYVTKDKFSTRVTVTSDLTYQLILYVLPKKRFT
ncbi:hypothetical protein HanIR_Chr02g0063211 [Helianthus annuus]|nr:hypothetical protein HanIR_Chr02g0063211 [Helianthus annuus]